MAIKPAKCLSLIEWEWNWCFYFEHEMFFNISLCTEMEESSFIFDIQGMESS